MYITHYMYPIYKPYNKMASYTVLSAGAHWGHHRSPRAIRQQRSQLRAHAEFLGAVHGAAQGVDVKSVEPGQS